MNNYVVCAVQRAGKTWIVNTLNRLGLGDGMELLTEFERNCAPEQARLSAAADSGGMAGLARAFAEVTVEEGLPCVGLALQWNNLDVIPTERRPAELTGFIRALNPCTVFFLRRRDVLAQAISHYLMFESGYAHSTDPDSARQQRAGVPYDRAVLDRWVAFTRQGYAGWSNLFAAAGMEPVNLYYEDFVDNPKTSFAGLAERIAGRGFDPEVVGAAATGLSRVSDEKNEVFRARYLAGE